MSYANRNFLSSTCRISYRISDCKLREETGQYGQWDDKSVSYLIKKENKKYILRSF